MEQTPSANAAALAPALPEPCGYFYRMGWVAGRVDLARETGEAAHEGKMALGWSQDWKGRYAAEVEVTRRLREEVRVMQEAVEFTGERYGFLLALVRGVVIRGDAVEGLERYLEWMAACAAVRAEMRAGGFFDHEKH